MTSFFHLNVDEERVHIFFHPLQYTMFFPPGTYKNIALLILRSFVDLAD